LGRALRDVGRNATGGGVKGGAAEELMTIPLPLRETTVEPLCQYTADGPVLQTLFTLPDAKGQYTFGRWLVAPRTAATAHGRDAHATTSADEARMVADAQGHAVEQLAVEALVDGEVVAKEPTRTVAAAYDRTGGRGPTPKAPRREVVVPEWALNPDPSFEDRERLWALGHSETAAAWSEAHVYSGDVALDLSCREDGLSLAQTNGPGSRMLAVEPNAVYEVSFQAKCTAGEAEVQVNFYAVPSRYDFLHVITPIPADSEWHEIRVEVPTGDFSPVDGETGYFSRHRGIAPALRLWAIDKEQRTYVDDVHVRRVR